MTKRNLITILWFIVGWWAGELLVGPLGVPYFLSLVPAVAFAAFVRFDPLHLLWSPSTPTARRLPINELADELDGNAAKHARAGTDHSRV